MIVDNFFKNVYIFSNIVVFMVQNIGRSKMERAIYNGFEDYRSDISRIATLYEKMARQRAYRLIPPHLTG